MTRILIYAISLLFVAGLQLRVAIAEERLVLTGSSTVAPIAGEIARLYEKSHPGVHIDIQTGGSSRGIIDLRRGLSDIAMVSRALRPEERDDLAGHMIARDGLVVIVHENNPIRRLSSDAIRRIYTGKARNWSDFGGPPGTIVIVSKAEGRATLELFLEYFGLESKNLTPDIIIGDNQQGIKIVVGNPNAIAYVALSTAIYSIRNGDSIALVALDGIEPTAEAVATGRYPLIRELNLVTGGTPIEPLAQMFIEFAVSERVLPVLESFDVAAPAR